MDQLAIRFMLILVITCTESSKVLENIETLLSQCIEKQDSLFEELGTLKENQERHKDYVLRTQAKALISGTHYYINPWKLSSSSEHNAYYGPYCSRLLYPKPSYCHGWAWCDDLNAGPRQWIQADLDDIFMIMAVATQGREDASQWVSSYKLAARVDEIDHFYEENGMAKVFAANEDTNIVVRHELDPPLEGQYIRLYVLTHYNHACMRWELYGWPKNLIDTFY